VQENLLTRIAPRLRALDSGGYARAYRHAGRNYRDPLHVLVAELLDSVKVRYKEDLPVSENGTFSSDFSFNDTVVLIDRELNEIQRKELRKSGKKVIMLVRSAKRSDSSDPGIHIVGLETENDGGSQTIFLDDPSFNFDYAHILPKTEKCSVMHGHTSSALVEIIGPTVDGMVVDFNDAKPVIRDAIRELDHKLLINERYVTGRDGNRVDLKFRTVHGEFELKVPVRTTVLLTGEATVENLAKELLDRIAPKMPSNVTAVGVYVYEGLNKGTHLLAQVHRREEEKARRLRRRRNR
jgi:6-pyruvoyltetrahydropterin/6-carboxytetrahydropterin synthase